MENRVVTTELRAKFLIHYSIYDNGKEAKEYIVKLKQKWIVDSLSLEASHRTVPPNREYHNEVLVETIQNKIGVPSVVFPSMIKNKLPQHLKLTN
jgi:hypothetical protein